MRLEEFGFTPDIVVSGDLPEFDTVANNKKEKRPTYVSAVVDSVIEAVFSDLADAYREIQSMAHQIDEVTQDLEVARNSIKEAEERASLKAEDDNKLRQTQNMLSDLDTLVTGLKSKREEDARQIIELQNQLSQAENNPEVAQLKQRVSDLEKVDADREAEYVALANDVNTVLDELEARFIHLQE